LGPILDWSPDDEGVPLPIIPSHRPDGRGNAGNGDVLFNRTNSPALIGKTALYTGERPAVYAGYLIRVRCAPNLNPAFLTFCLNSPAGRDYCWRVKTDGVSQSNINAKKLAAFQLPLPSLSEQGEVIRRVETAFTWLDRVAAEHANASRLLQKLDQAILAKAFRGELVSPNAVEV
jgi:type I restriction enzyme S subunit